MKHPSSPTGPLPATNLTLLCALIAFISTAGCEPIRRDLMFDRLPPRVPTPPRLLDPHVSMAEETVRSEVLVQDWWLDGERSVKRPKIAILKFVAPRNTNFSNLGDAAAARLSVYLLHRGAELIDREFISRVLQELTLAKAGEMMDLTDEQLAKIAGRLKKPDYFIIGSVTSYETQNEQVTLVSTYDPSDLQRYEKDFEQYKAAVLIYLDAIENEYIAKLRNFVSANTREWKIKIQRLNDGLITIRNDLQRLTAADLLARGRSLERRYPVLVLPIEPGTAEDFARRKRQAREARKTRAELAELQAHIAYDPLRLYSADKMPTPPAILDLQRQKREEFREVTFPVQVSEPAIAIRVIKVNTGEVIGIGSYSCTDTSIGEALRRTTEAFGARFLGEE